MRDDLGEIKGQINKVKEEEIDAFLGFNGVHMETE